MVDATENAASATTTLAAPRTDEPVRVADDALSPAAVVQPDPVAVSEAEVTAASTTVTTLMSVAEVGVSTASAAFFAPGRRASNTPSHQAQDRLARKSLCCALL